MDPDLMLRIRERAYTFGLQTAGKPTRIGFALRLKFSTMRLINRQRHSPRKSSHALAEGEEKASGEGGKGIAGSRAIQAQARKWRLNCRW